MACRIGFSKFSRIRPRVAALRAIIQLFNSHYSIFPRRKTCVSLYCAKCFPNVSEVLTLSHFKMKEGFI